MNRPYIEIMREDTKMSRAAFSRKYKIPVRTLEAWASGDREAPEYVIDLLGRAVYSDITGRRPIFYVIAIGDHDEWNEGHFESYIEAVKTARENLEKTTVKNLKVEIRLYVEDVEKGDCENFDCDLVSFE